MLANLQRDLLVLMISRGVRAFALNVPIFLGGFLQLAHDVIFYYLFRGVKPPEERTQKA